MTTAETLGHRTRRYGVALTVGCAVVVWIIARARSLSPLFPVSDEALLEIYTLQALAGRLLVGPYSRFMWHHPGPIYFYLLAPFYVATDHLTSGLNAGALTINLTALLVAGWAFARHRAYGLALAFATFGIAYVFRVGEMFANSWNAHVAVLAAMTTVIASASVAAGDVALLPVAAAFASFASQTHLAVMPLMVVAAALSVTGIFIQRRGAVVNRHRVRRWLLCTGVVLMAAWALPIVEALSNRGGNFARLIEFFVRSADRGVPIARAVTAWSDMFTGAVSLHLRMPIGLPFQASTTVWTTPIVVVELVLLSVVAVWARRTKRGLHLWLATATLLSCLVSFAATTRIQDGILDHEVFWVSAVGLVSATLIVGTGLTIILDGLKDPWHWQRLLANTALAVLICTALQSGLNEIDRIGVRSRHPPDDERAARNAAIAARDVLKRLGMARPLIRVNQATWAVTAGLVLQLYKSKILCRVESSAVWMFGEPFTPRGDEDFELMINDGDLHRLSIKGPGRITVLDQPPYFVEGRPLENQK